MMHDLFTDDEESPRAEPGESERCTPERLLAFVQGLGRSPTLEELKERFGGIIGPMLDGWELRKRGLL